MLEAFLVSTGVVALSEIGDKTQLLSLMLAARFRQPWPIVGGIFVATLVNHTIAGAIGAWLRNVVPPDALKWIVALSFFAVAIWALVPDSLDEKPATASRLGVFTVTVIAFFLAEMGDKTQLATVALGARYHATVLVTIGTTLGMLVSDGLAVFLGDRLASRVQARWVRWVGAALFFAFAVASAWAAVRG